MSIGELLSRSLLNYDGDPPSFANCFPGASGPSVVQDILAAVARISCTCAYEDSEEMTSHSHLCAISNTHKHSGSL